MPRRRRRRRYYYTPAPSGRRFDEFAPLGLNLSAETKRGVAIIVFLVIAVISALAILGAAGSFGQIVTKVLKLLFGAVAYAAPLLFLGVVVSLFLGGRLREEKKERQGGGETSELRTYLGAGLFALSLTGILHLFAMRQGAVTPFELAKSGEGGGYMGLISSLLPYSLMGFTASLVVLFALMFISLLIAFDLSIHSMFRGMQRLAGRMAGSASGNEQAVQKPSGAGEQQIKINTMQDLGFSVNAVKKNLAPVRGSHSDEMLTEEEEREDFGEPAERVELEAAPLKFKKGYWKLPTTELLEATTSNVNSGNIEANVKIIKKTLEDFGIAVEMGDVNVGPTVTQYTFRPAVGVKLAQIVSRQADMALALAAPSIRIEAPIPGKSLVGIEVPNSLKAIVGLRDLLESDSFKNSEASLPFVLGRDVAGHPVMADLGTMPHLLIAGATGTGKSVCINAIITSFLYRNSPEELRLIVIDPKRVELILYNGIPHLLTPVVTDHKEAVNALKWMVSEMDERYRLLAEAGKRNIEEYNQSQASKLPYLVLIVDELADLMTVAKIEVEAAIVRLAQMSRAVGLHLVLATQRPSVNIITGLIKANITSRIAFAVASQIDSRTILDMAGAEDLLGGGDMLYITANLPKPKRIQVPFINEQEVRRVVNFLKEQAGTVSYQLDVTQKSHRALGVNAGIDLEELDDDLLAAAIEEIRRARKASASLLQRRLKVGYARAARILDILEERGLIGPADGAKPRDIYLEDEKLGE